MTTNNPSISIQAHPSGVGHLADSSPTLTIRSRPANENESSVCIEEISPSQPMRFVLTFEGNIAFDETHLLDRATDQTKKKVQELISANKTVDPWNLMITRKNGKTEHLDPSSEEAKILIQFCKELKIEIPNRHIDARTRLDGFPAFSINKLHSFQRSTWENIKHTLTNVKHWITRNKEKESSVEYDKLDKMHITQSQKLRCAKMQQLLKIMPEMIRKMKHASPDILPKVTDNNALESIAMNFESIFEPAVYFAMLDTKEPIDSNAYKARQQMAAKFIRQNDLINKDFYSSSHNLALSPLNPKTYDSAINELAGHFALLHSETRENHYKGLCALNLIEKKDGFEKLYVQFASAIFSKDDSSFEKKWEQIKFPLSQALSSLSDDQKSKVMGEIKNILASLKEQSPPPSFS